MLHIDPYEGKEWRTGADEQTTLVTNRALKFGDLSVPAGTYGIHTIPVKGNWQLIVSKREKGWGIPYPDGQEPGSNIDDHGQAAEASRDPHLHDRGHTQGRDASHRLGQHPREHSVYRGLDDA